MSGAGTLVAASRRIELKKTGGDLTFPEVSHDPVLRTAQDLCQLASYFMDRHSVAIVRRVDATLDVNVPAIELLPKITNEFYSLEHLQKIADLKLEGLSWGWGKLVFDFAVANSTNLAQQKFAENIGRLATRIHRSDPVAAADATHRLLGAFGQHDPNNRRASFIGFGELFFLKGKVGEARRYCQFILKSVYPLPEVSTNDKVLSESSTLSPPTDIEQQRNARGIVAIVEGLESLLRGCGEKEGMRYLYAGKNEMLSINPCALRELRMSIAAHKVALTPSFRRVCTAIANSLKKSCSLVGEQNLMSPGEVLKFAAAVEHNGNKAAA